MTKQDFLSDLRRRLSGVPEEDVEASLEYYSEMIDDRIEEGHDEQAAVDMIGSVSDVAAHILGDIPVSKRIQARVKPKTSLRALEIVLLVVGSPIWLSLLAVVLSVVVTLFAVLLSVLAVFWSVTLALGVMPLGAVVYAITAFLSGLVGEGVLSLGMGCMLAALGIGMFFMSLYSTKAMLGLSKNSFLWIKSCFLRKESCV